ncbi:MAG: pyridoxamine 5'-phosphate oxidase family protein [Nitrospiraceae bacterium]
MGRTFASITEELVAFIGRQQMFFVATAPLAATGLLNVSPKGLDSFVVIDPQTVAYLDLTGSGAETIAHLRENGRIVVMFSSFDEQAKTVRLHGTGRAVMPQDADFVELYARFPPHPGVRSIIRIAVTRVSDSCGFGAPRMRYEGQRDELATWAMAKGPEGMADYRRRKNRVSIDGLPAVDEPEPMA